MLNKYKIFAGHMIVESDNTKELKIQLLNFVKNAAEPQVKNFILNGTIRESIKEKDVTTINEQFEKAYIQEGAFKSILGILLLPEVWLVWRGLGALVNQTKLKCGAFAVSNQRDLCMAAGMKNIEKRRISLLQKSTQNCKHAKNPEKCMKKIKEMIAKSQKKIQKYQSKIDQGKVKGYDTKAAEKKSQRKKGSLF